MEILLRGWIKLVFIFAFGFKVRLIKKIAVVMNFNLFSPFDVSFIYHLLAFLCDVLNTP